MNDLHSEQRLMRIFRTPRRLALLAVTILCVSQVPAFLHGQGRAVNWTLKETAAIGDGSNDIILERVYSLQLLKNGRILIADVKAKNVFVADSLGRSLPALGRTGSGPGEYRAPQALATIGDTIAVLDPGNSRIGLFNSKGEWQGQWMSQQLSGGATVRLYRVPGQQFYNLGFRRDGNKSLTVFHHFDRSGARDTLVLPEQPTNTNGILCKVPTGISFFDSKFHTRNLRIAGDGGSILVARTDAYRIVKQKVSGEALVTFSGTGAQVPISNAAWDSSSADWTKFQKESGTSGCDKTIMMRPSLQPVIRAMWWDDAGRLWVERIVSTNRYAFDVFDAKGTLIATMPAPDRVDDVEPSVVGTRIALLTINGEGVPVVRVYRFGIAK